MSEISSLTELLSVYNKLSPLAAKKELTHIDRQARAFIGRSSFLVIATADADGWPDASPRGDPPGFVTVEDDTRLLMPDRPGNNRVDSFRNLVANPRIGMLFFVPGTSALAAHQWRGAHPHRCDALRAVRRERQAGARRRRGHDAAGLLSLRQIADPLQAVEPGALAIARGAREPRPGDRRSGPRPRRQQGRGVGRREHPRAAVLERSSAGSHDTINAEKRRSPTAECAGE